MPLQKKKADELVATAVNIIVAITPSASPANQATVQAGSLEITNAGKGTAEEVDYFFGQVTLVFHRHDQVLWAWNDLCTDASGLNLNVHRSAKKGEKLK